MSLRAPAVVAVLVSAVLSACGGGDEEAPPAPAAKAPPEAIDRANANCRRLVRDVKEIGRGALRAEDVFEAQDENIVRPALPVIERIGRSQQAVAATTDDPNLELYAELFDPILVLSRERLRVGRAMDRSAATDLEAFLQGLTAEQRAAARAAGLSDCDVDFQQVLFNSLTD
jgi:hypothetical protein